MPPKPAPAWLNKARAQLDQKEQWIQHQVNNRANKVLKRVAYNRAVRAWPAHHAVLNAQAGQGGQVAAAPVAAAPVAVAPVAAAPLAAPAPPLPPPPPSPTSGLQYYAQRALAAPPRASVSGEYAPTPPEIGKMSDHQIDQREKATRKRMREDADFGDSKMLDRRRTTTMMKPDWRGNGTTFLKELLTSARE